MSDSTPPDPSQGQPPVPPPGQPPGVPPVPAAPIPPAGQPWAGYGQPPGGYLPPAQTSGKAVAILVLGIASLLMGCLIPAIVALAMSGGAKREIAASGGRLSGDGLIKGGVICSWVSIGLTVAIILLIIVVFALGAAVDSNFEDTGRGIQSSMTWLRP
jgi:hypothetical protein